MARTTLGVATARLRGARQTRRAGKASARSLCGNLKTKTCDVSVDKDTTGDAYPTTSNRLSSATIGSVTHTFTHDSSGLIRQYTCKDQDDSGPVPFRWTVSLSGRAPVY